MNWEPTIKKYITSSHAKIVARDLRQNNPWENIPMLIPPWTATSASYVKNSFVFPSELDAHMIKHDTLPNFSCNIVDCSQTYFRKAELTAHIKTHDGKLWRCKHKDCTFEVVDKRYLTAHKKKHSDNLNYFHRHCEEKFKYFEQCKCHEKAQHGK